MRLAFALALLGVLAQAAVAQDVAKVVSATAPAVEDNPNAARVLWLDKQNNARQTLVLNVGTAQTIGTLALRMEKCVMNLKGQPNTDAAWLQISEPGRGNDWFKGWMINTLPEVASLDHPRFDVQLIGCGTKPRQKAGPVAKSGAAPAEGIDTETVGQNVSDTAAESVDEAADPFYVSGVGTDEAAGISVTTPATTPVATPNPTPATPTLNEAPANEPADVAPASAPTPTEPAPTTEEQGLHQMMDGVY